MDFINILILSFHPHIALPIGLFLIVVPVEITPASVHTANMLCQL